MSIYGITAKIIGMYKEESNDLSRIEYNILAKSDKNEYLTIRLVITDVYESYGSYGIMFTSHVDMEIDIDDITEYITHFPINEHYLDLNSIVKYCNEEINELKCDIFEISRYGKKENRRYSTDYICPPRGEVEFNVDLFVNYDILEKRKQLMNHIKEELLAVALHPLRINKLVKQNIKIGEFEKYI